MGTGKSKLLLAAFLGVIASTYAGPVVRADESEPGDPVALFEQGSDDVELPQGQTVEVGSFGEIDLHVKDLDLTKVLQLLSIQSQRNIIASRNVAGTVSADLYDVDFYEALDAILQTNGFGYEEKGNFIYVYTADELKAIQDSQRVTTTEVVQLDYLTAADASTFVSPLLSGAGSIAVSGEVGKGFQPSLGSNGEDSFSSQATLVIHDYPENVEAILAVIEQIDVRPKQVLVESMILSAKVDEDNEFGVDFSVFADVEIGDFTSPLGAVDELLGGDANTLEHGSAVQSTVGNTGQAGGFKIGIFGNEFSVFVRALDQITDTTVLASPKVLVLNRQRADLLVGERLGYLSSTSTDTSTTQTVEFLDVGTQLTVRPYVSSDDFVRLELRPSVSEGSTSVEADTIIPNETTSEMVSNVMVRSGQTIVLGGFFKEQNKYTRRQVPGAGDIPLLGYAFRGQEDDIVRDEVIFLVKPTVMRDETLVSMGEDALHGTRLAMFGSREGLLPWGHSRLAHGAIGHAHESIRQGDTDRALWHVDIALSLEPTNVEARRLKEQLTGETFYFYTDSILDEAIDSEAAAFVAPELGSNEFGFDPFDGSAAPQATDAVDESVPSEWNDISEVADWFDPQEQSEPGRGPEASGTGQFEVVPAAETAIEGEYDIDPQQPGFDEMTQDWQAAPDQAPATNWQTESQSQTDPGFEWFDAVEEQAPQSEPSDRTAREQDAADWFEGQSGQEEPADFGWFDVVDSNGQPAEPTEAAESDSWFDPVDDAASSDGEPLNIFDFVNDEVARQESQGTVSEVETTE